ncbi:unnamed protein product, partial [Didymodactylos carnosus]
CGYLCYIYSIKYLSEMDENPKKIKFKIKLGSANDSLHEDSSLSSNCSSNNDVKISFNNMDKTATSMTENQQTKKKEVIKLKTKSTSNAPQMAGWFRLMETVRKTNVPSASAPNPFQNLIKTFRNSNNNSNHTSHSPTIAIANKNTAKHQNENSSSPCATSAQNNMGVNNFDSLLSPLSNVSAKSHTQSVRLDEEDEEEGTPKVVKNPNHSSLWNGEDDEQQQQPLTYHNIINPTLSTEQELTVCQKLELVNNEQEQQKTPLPINSSSSFRLSTPSPSAASLFVSSYDIGLEDKTTERHDAVENENNKESSVIQPELSQAMIENVDGVIQEKLYKKKKRIIIKKSSKSKPTSSSFKKKQEQTQQVQQDSDDELLIDIRNRKSESCPRTTSPITVEQENSVHQSSVDLTPINSKFLPIATDLNSLPGHVNEKIHRDSNADQSEIATRFLSYNDTETLTDHIRLLRVDDETKYCVKFLREKQPIFKSRTKGLTGVVRGKVANHNAFQKMNKPKLLPNLHANNFYLKTVIWSDIYENQTKITATKPPSSFTTSWPNNLNTRKKAKSSNANSSTSKNLFQVTQRLKTFTIKPNKTSRTSPGSLQKETNLAQTTSESQQYLLVKQMKDFYFQTYGKQLYSANASHQQFGTKPKLSLSNVVTSISKQSVGIQTDTSPVVEQEPKEPIVVTPLPPQRRSKKHQQPLEKKKKTDHSVPLPIKEISYNDFFSTSSLTTKQRRLKKFTKSKHQRTSSSSSFEYCEKKRDKEQRKSSSTCMTTTDIEEDIADDFVGTSHSSAISLLPFKKHILPKNKNDESKIVDERRISVEIEESAPFIIKESIVLLTPTPTPIQTRNRHISSTSTNSLVQTTQLPINSRKRKLSSSTEQKSLMKTDTATKKNSDGSINHQSSSKSRRISDSSSSLPPLYNFIVRGEKVQHLDYQLPYDMYWTWKRQNKGDQENKKVLKPCNEIIEKKTKKIFNYKKILKNSYSDPTIRQNLLTSYTSETSPVCECKSPSNCADEHCLNRMIFTECTPQSCPCGLACTNQKIRKYEWFKHLEVYDTKKYDLGLRTTTDIPKGTFLCEYVGEIITNDEFLNRMNSKYLNDQHHYTMKLSQNLVIDAYRMGNVARFANHSCQPNCEFQKWTVDGLQRMCMFTLKNIKKHEELTYDYNFQCFNENNQQKCHCSSEKCRKIIGAKPPLLHSMSTSLCSSTFTQEKTTTTQRLTRHDKRLIKHCSVFLMRNLVKVKQIKQQKQLKQQQIKPDLPIIPTSEQQLFLSYCFCYQNYYHQQKPIVNQNGATASSVSLLSSLRKKNDKLTSTVRHRAQLTYILNDILRLLMCYKRANDDILPATALKKCPSKKLYPMYYEVIERPIDLTIIKTSLDNGEYLCYKQFEDDLLLLFNNAVTYCGADSDVGSAVIELQGYCIHILLPLYKPATDLFKNLNHSYQPHSFSTSTTSFANVSTFEDFLARFHKSEIMSGQMRNILYHLIYDIEIETDTLSMDDEHSPVVYKIFNHNSTSSHQKSRPDKQTSIILSSSSSYQSQLQKIKRNLNDDNEYIIHCRCRTVYDDGLFVQCFACQLWQHASCVDIDRINSSPPYLCFECNPTCECDISKCQISQVNIRLREKAGDESAGDECYKILTREDGFAVRTNECYYIVSQRERAENNTNKHQEPLYDIFYVERLYITKSNKKYAYGFYYIRPYETFHEPNRKFFHNEVFRSPTTNSFPLNIIVKQCFVVDQTTYCKGKPVSDYYLNLNDIYICEYRVDKLARTFYRLPKARQISVNTKSYCFDSYIEKLTIKRDYL